MPLITDSQLENISENAVRALTGVCSCDDPRARIPTRLSIPLLATKAAFSGKQLLDASSFPAFPVLQSRAPRQMLPRLLQTYMRSIFLPRNQSNLLMGLPCCARGEGVKCVWEGEEHQREVPMALVTAFVPSAEVGVCTTLCCPGTGALALLIRRSNLVLRQVLVQTLSCW